MLYLLLGLSALGASPVSAGPQQVVTVEVPRQFKMVTRHAAGGIEMIEYVMPPDTNEHWRQKVTIQVLHGAGARTRVDDFYESWRKIMGAKCPVSTQTDTWGAVDGVRAIKNDYACLQQPENGLPDDLETVMIDGPEDITVVQINFGRTRPKKDQRVLDRFFGSLKVCDRAALRACSARKGAGFVVTSK